MGGGARADVPDPIDAFDTEGCIAQQVQHKTMTDASVINREFLKNVEAEEKKAKQ